MCSGCQSALERDATMPSTNYLRGPFTGEILWPKMEKHIPQTIGVYFDRDGTAQCTNFERYVAEFVQHCCSEIDTVVLDLAAEGVDGKSREDWISIHVDYVKQVMSKTIGDFAVAIANSESLQLSASIRIPCSRGYNARSNLHSEYVRAQRALQADYENRMPRSKIAQLKRKNRTDSWPFHRDPFPCAC